MESFLQNTPLLIVMAGLPGTGKSALAALLAQHLHALVLNKDMIRARLFSDKVDFSREQDDLCMEVVFLFAEYMMRTHPEQSVIIDGRTFSQVCQMERLLAWTGSLNRQPVIIECICDDAVARERLDHDQQTAVHPAGNRNYQLYLELKRKADPLTAERLVIDTGREPIELSVERCLAYVRSLPQPRSLSFWKG